MNNATVRIAWMASLLAAIVIAVAALLFEPGPAWLWVSEYCPETAGSCPGFPIGGVLMMPAIAGWLLMAGHLINRVGFAKEPTNNA